MANISFLDKAMHIDRRYIFIFIALAVAIPLILTFQLPIATSPMVKGIYDKFDELPDGSTVILSGDYDPASAPELQPMAKSILRHMIKKKFKIIMMGLWPMGPGLLDQAMLELQEAKELGAEKYEYGADYIQLGYVPGGAMVLQAILRSFKSAYTTEQKFNKPIMDYPIMRGISNATNIAGAFEVSAGSPGPEAWIMYLIDPSGMEVYGAGVTAVSAPMLAPYVQTGQMKGLLGGLKGAAEYETLTGVAGDATKFMASQSIAHLVIILFIIIGNLAFFAKQMRKE